MNQVFLIGNLTRDPEHRTTNGGISTCSFTLAVEREQSKKDRESGNKVTDYITIITWRNTADLCARYLTKGRQVAVRGSWHNRNYEDKDGNKRTVSECITDEVKFLGAPPQRDDSADDEYPPYR